MGSVDHLVALTRWPGQGLADTDWPQAEAKLGLALPPDYLELARRFPVGTFQGYLDFLPYPDALADWCQHVIAGCAAGGTTRPTNKKSGCAST